MLTGKMEPIDNIMYLRYQFELSNRDGLDMFQYPYIYRQWYFHNFLITESVPLENYNGSPGVVYAIPDVLFDEEAELSSQTITPPPVPPNLVCIETIIKAEGRERGVNIVCEGEHYVKRIVEVFEDDGLIRIRPTPNFLQHVRIFGKTS
jgi:hypothetical protein